MHVQPDIPLPDNFQVAADIPDDLPIYNIDESSLPPEWRITLPSLPLFRDMGSQWLQLLASAFARVPATTTPGEFSFLSTHCIPTFRYPSEIAFNISPQ